MKVKTTELEGPALDWAVAKAAGYKPSVYSTQSIRAELPTGGVIAPFMPGFRWDQGGPILEREKIGISYFKSDPMNREPFVVAAISTDYAGESAMWDQGPTPLIAAMRCLVASKLGPEVEVPDELVAHAHGHADASEDQVADDRPRSRA